MKLIVFAVHGCPTNALGPYGNEWIATPTLDRWASEGVVFDRHLSDCPSADAARAGWLTGQCQTPPWPDTPKLPATPVNLLADLCAAGVRTVLLDHCRPENRPDAWLRQEWQEVHELPPTYGPGTPAKPLLDCFPEVLNSLGSSQPTLVWVEWDRLLPPWDVPNEVFEVYIEELLEGLEDDQETESLLPWIEPAVGWFDRDDLASWELLHRSYATAMTAFDADLARLWEKFHSGPRANDTILALTADYGFPLGQHGVIGRHRPWLHEELIHLPLIVRLANAEQAGRRVSSLTQPADFGATIRHWFGLPAAPTVRPEIDGLDLTPLCHGLPGRRRYVVSGCDLADCSERAIHTAERALLLPIQNSLEDDSREPMLYGKPEDYWELNNLYTASIDEADALGELARRLISGTPLEEGAD